MKQFETGFSTPQYLESQVDHIQTKIRQARDAQIFLEFGGKPFGDHHAARVLPGYDPDCKAMLLKELMPDCNIAMVVNARDVLLPAYGRTLNGRIRGDSGLRYDRETIRLLRQSQDLGLDISSVVLAVSPLDPIDRDKEAIGNFKDDLQKEGYPLKIHHEVAGYPDPEILKDSEASFEKNDQVSQDTRNLVVFSPGGGSGKFGVLLSEMYRALKNGQKPAFLKFETFPIYNEKPDHPLNLAFEAATADLNNKVVLLDLKQENPISSYDKDIENFALLKRLFSLMAPGDIYSELIVNPTQMGVNRITDGITDQNVIKRACWDEINRRVARYQREVSEGNEKHKTLEKAQLIRSQFIKTNPTFQTSLI